MKKHENLILLLLVVLIAAFPLVWNAGAEFGGADDQVKDVVAGINPDYKPWFAAIWSPPSSEVESFLFALQAAIGAGFRVHSTPAGFATPDLASSHVTTLAPRLWSMAGVGPADVDVVQCYENFTGGVLMTLVEHGFFAPKEAMEFLTLENLLAPTGKLPLNTSGGNLAECYMHGLELQIEAVRQLRGQATSQVPDVNVSLAAAGPMVTPVSTILFGSEAVL